MLRNEAEEHVKKFHESLKTLPPQVSEVIGEIRLLSRSSKGKGIERIEFTLQKP